MARRVGPISTFGLSGAKDTSRPTIISASDARVASLVSISRTRRIGDSREVLAVSRIEAMREPDHRGGIDRRDAKLRRPYRRREHDGPTMGIPEPKAREAHHWPVVP